MVSRMTESEWLHTLPSKGPFRTSWSFWVRTWLGPGLGFLTLFGSAIAVLVYAFFVLAQLSETEHIWKRGISGRILHIQGQKRTTESFFRSYELRVVFRTRTQHVYQNRSAFFCFFSGPRKGDLAYIRYLKSNPAHAVLSWEYEARHHGYVFVVILCVVGLILLGFSVRILRRAIQTTLYTLHLLTEGSLVLASIEDTHEVQHPKTAQVCKMYRFSWFLEGPFQGRYRARSQQLEPWMFTDETRLFLIAIPRFPEYLVLQKDGYPLHLPELCSTVRCPSEAHDTPPLDEVHE